jgi:hypothetical protein
MPDHTGGHYGGHYKTGDHAHGHIIGSAPGFLHIRAQHNSLVTTSHGDNQDGRHTHAFIPKYADITPP